MYMYMYMYLHVKSNLLFLWLQFHSFSAIDYLNTKHFLLITVLLQTYHEDSNGAIVAAGPPDLSILTEELFTGCFGGGPGRLPDTSGVLSFNTGDMFPGKDYDLRVLGTKAPGRQASADVTLTVIPAAAPDVQIQ